MGDDKEPGAFTEPGSDRYLLDALHLCGLLLWGASPLTHAMISIRRLFPPVLLTAMAALATPAGGLLVAQEPRGTTGPFEVRGLDFRPDGGWRRRAAQVRANRQAMLRAGDFVGLNRPLLQANLLAGPQLSRAAVAGTLYAPVVLIHYPDFTSVYTASDYGDVLFSPTPGSVALPYSLSTFFAEMSNGLLQVEGRVFDPVQTDSVGQYYTNNCNGIGVLNSCPDGGQRFGNMLLAALDSISNRPGGDTVWNQFDNDGPDGLPNSGDDDGVVDVVQFFQPGIDGACQGSPGIWSHRWVMRAWNSGSMYVTNTPRRGVGGNPIPGQFLQVDDYIMQSGVGGATSCDGSQIAPIGTVAHEMGHVLDLPDLYDVTSQTQGIGDWGLMGTASFARPRSPGSYSAWSLVELGWVTVEELTGTRTITTGPRQLTDTVFLARTNDPGEHVLIANRQAVQSDTAQMNPAFTRPKTPGLLLWLVDEDRIASGRFSNQVNTGVRQGVSLMQADGLNQLRTSGLNNRGDAGDSYPGSTGNTKWGLRTAPAARTNFGEYTGFIIDQIEQLPDQAMRFRILRREPSLVWANLPGAAIKVDGAAYAIYEDVLPEGQVFTLDLDTVQVVSGGRTRGRFLAWSDGGDRMHDVVSGATPDSVTAMFTAEHRVRAIVDGPGSVTANVAGDLAAGIFLTAGSSVNLTVITPAGFVFAGWEGDTVSAATTIALAMTHPFDVEARFLAEQTIPVADATAEVLGTPTLSASQKNYLDTFGNRNGTFDLGDYLALLHRSGLVPGAAIMERLHPDRAPPRPREGPQP